MTRVLANGTFDILHPGHIHYLQESAALGDELYVVIARDSRAEEKKDRLCMDEDDRREVVEALEPVDRAILGSENSIFDTVQEVQPDIITLGHDQDFDREKLKEALQQRSLDCQVVRIDSKDSYSSSDYKS